MLGIISLYYFSKITEKFDSNLCLVIGLQSLSFILRNTSPIGWVPILLYKAYQVGPCKMLGNYLVGFLLIFAPMVGAATAIDSWYYGALTIVPWNFIKVNVFEGLSQTFGSDPVLQYVAKEIPIRFNIFLPALLLGILHHRSVCLNKKQMPYLVIYSLSIVIFLSMITHKEPKFLLPIFPPCFIFIGQYLQDKLAKKNSNLLKALVL
jgi:GPI mannosyltransferase 3